MIGVKAYTKDWRGYMGTYYEEEEMSKLDFLKQSVEDREKKENQISSNYLQASEYYPSAQEEFSQVAFMEHKEITKLLIRHIINLENRIKTIENDYHRVNSRLLGQESRLGLIEEILLEFKESKTNIRDIVRDEIFGRIQTSEEKLMDHIERVRKELIEK